MVDSVRLIAFYDILSDVLGYLVRGRTRRELFRALWGRGETGSVSELARSAQVAFSAAHRELEAMRAARLARAERRGSELRYQADTLHRHAGLLRQLATTDAELDEERRTRDDERVRAWLAALGAPLGSPEARGPVPLSEDVLAEALSLAHRDASVARFLPLLLWRERDRLDLGRLARAASRLNEKHALGYFLELAGRLGNEHRLVSEASTLRDRRRRKPRLFFAGPHGPRALAATRRNTPPTARRWGYLMNMGTDSFRSTFEKFKASR